MTLLGDIQDAATGTEVAVSTMLRKAQLLAARLHSEPLQGWATSELNGYGPDDELPSYRVYGAIPVRGQFVDQWGTSVHLPIPSQNIPQIPGLSEHVQDDLFRMYFREPVSAYETMLASDLQEFLSPWTDNQVAIVGPLIASADRRLLIAARIVPRTAVASLLDAIRTRLLTFTIELEREGSSVGKGVDEGQIAPHTVNQIFYNTFHGDNAIVSAAGRDAHVAAHQQIIGVDWDALRDELEGLGVPSQELGDLESAIAEDQAAGSQESKAVHAWLGRLAMRVGTGALTLGEGVGVEAITHVITKSLGIG
jgi:hypothetical protein